MQRKLNSFNEHFLLHRQRISKALKLLNNCRNMHVVIWNFDIGFLLLKMRLWCPLFLKLWLWCWKIWTTNIVLLSLLYYRFIITHSRSKFANLPWFIIKLLFKLFLLLRCKVWLDLTFLLLSNLRFNCIYFFPTFRSAGFTFNWFGLLLILCVFWWFFVKLIAR